MDRSAHRAGESALALKPGTAWSDAWGRCRTVAPQAFGDDGHVRNLVRGGWRSEGAPHPAVSPVDGSPVAGPLLLDAPAARTAVAAALDQHRAWRHVPLPERRARTAAALDALTEHRALLALLQVWDIGRPWRQAQADVDRALDGVRRHLERAENVEEVVPEGGTPLPGPVSAVAGWDGPMSGLVHAMLVHALAGNAVIARAPADGGLACVTLACALSVREGLPFTLVSGRDRAFSERLLRAPEIGAVCRGGDTGERGGPGCRGVWAFSGWDALAPLLRRTFDHAGRRCTACPRFVVQRSLFADFLAAYLPAVRALAYGHPLAVSREGEALPELDFGPLVNAARAAELAGWVRDAVDDGAVPLHRGSLEDGRFLPGQDASAYLAPTTLLSPPASSPLHRAEPSGPVHSIVLADTEAELLAAMNAGNGSRGAALSTDDEDLFDRLAPRLRAHLV